MARITKDVIQWMPLPEDKDGAELLIKHLKPGVVQKIVDETMELVQSSGKQYMDVKVNPGLKRWKILRESIQGWRGFFDEAGNHMEFTEENLMLMALEIENFATKVESMRAELAEKVQANLKAASGN